MWFSPFLLTTTYISLVCTTKKMWLLYLGRHKKMRQRHDVAKHAKIVADFDCKIQHCRTISKCSALLNGNITFTKYAQETMFCSQIRETTSWHVHKVRTLSRTPVTLFKALKQSLKKSNKLKIHVGIFRHINWTFDFYATKTVWLKYTQSKLSW